MVETRSCCVLMGAPVVSAVKVSRACAFSSSETIASVSGEPMSLSQSAVLILALTAAAGVALATGAGASETGSTSASKLIRWSSICPYGLAGCSPGARSIYSHRALAQAACSKFHCFLLEVDDLLSPAGQLAGFFYALSFFKIFIKFFGVGKVVKD